MTGNVPSPAGAPWTALSFACVTSGVSVAAVSAYIFSNLSKLRVSPDIAAGLRAVVFRSGFVAGSVAVLLCAAACWRLIWRQSHRQLFVAVVADILIVGAFVMAPWVAARISSGERLVDITSDGMYQHSLELWVPPVSLVGLLPSLAAALGVIVFAIVTWRAKDRGSLAA
jgi:hypothetical protein